MRVKIAMAAGDAGDAHALQQHADFLLAVGDGAVRTLPDGDLIRVPDEFLCAGLAGPALRGLITLRVPARPIQGCGVRVFVIDVEGLHDRI